MMERYLQRVAIGAARRDDRRPFSVDHVRLADVEADVRHQGARLQICTLQGQRIKFEITHEADVVRSHSLVRSQLRLEDGASCKLCNSVWVRSTFLSNLVRHTLVFEVGGRGGGQGFFVGGEDRGSCGGCGGCCGDRRRGVGGDGGWGGGASAQRGEDEEQHAGGREDSVAGVARRRGSHAVTIDRIATVLGCFHRLVFRPETR